MSTTEDHQEGLEVYEVGYLLLPSVPEDKLSLVVDSIKTVIKDGGGKELDSEDPIKQELSYPMSKTVGASRYIANDAYLGWVKFEAEPSSAPKVKESLEKLDGMLRFLLIKAPRETAFTFAQAEARIAEAEALLEEAAAALEAGDNAVVGSEGEPVVE